MSKLPPVGALGTGAASVGVHMRMEKDIGKSISGCFTIMVSHLFYVG